MARVYDLRTVVCTVGGVPISGYGEDDAIAFEWAEAIASVKVSGDGQATYSRMNNRVLNATLTLMSTSRAIPLLQAVIEAQHGDNLGIPVPVLVVVPFAMIDPILGDQVIGDCVVTSRFAPSKSREAGELELELSLPSPKTVIGALNVL